MREASLIALPAFVASRTTSRLLDAKETFKAARWEAWDMVVQYCWRRAWPKSRDGFLRSAELVLESGSLDAAENEQLRARLLHCFSKVVGNNEHTFKSKAQCRGRRRPKPQTRRAPPASATRCSRCGGRKARRTSPEECGAMVPRYRAHTAVECALRSAGTGAGTCSAGSDANAASPAVAALPHRRRARVCAVLVVVLFFLTPV